MLENVRTYLRIKPQAIPEDIVVGGDSVIVDGSSFCFDRVFRGSTQQEVFQEISKSLLVECMQGYNCTLFAYGQTGSGKTYTIQGNAHSIGIVQRSLSLLHRNADLRISLSFVEIYNETMLDLFDPEAILSIREDPLCGVVVDGLTIVDCDSYEKSMEMYSRGTRTRRTSSTSMNKESSRSHSVFTVYLKSSGEVMSRSSRVCFVDLAGSERLREREVEETKMKETANINKSLLYLGKVINKLSNGEEGHIGYRESKLTFLLKDSLGGNCKLTVIGNVSLESRSDSINTMNFLQRSKMIRNLAVVNSDVNGELEEVKSRLKTLDSENQSLKARIALIDSQIQEESRALPSYHYDIKRVKDAVDDIMSTVLDLGETVGRVSGVEFDKNRRLLLSIHECFMSMHRRQEDAESSTKRKRRDAKE
ncbi:KINESIN-LIKE PROTEIN [Encephalitozoon cuniculi GB-M1]|uniref:Kinesin-like protein n=1 Tax=Encephalitozoon cuniculi (strain GB-M1) TaxID=284813 RepID=Q8SRB7_ENCCU|nr:kinesin-like protein [Encephalitozoon cuniculi GB-M1]KMV65617.1 kinesin-like protein [Encephalitozoon cuniculi EcunIII-L]UYI27019.1 kinesin-like protein [Encephalitozoon cuniculi]CAD26395.1 KINESIN-LIKE PROTEIN [Encephalitozoon cuniculi GB-M1]